MDEYCGFCSSFLTINTGALFKSPKSIKLIKTHNLKNIKNYCVYYFEGCNCKNVKSVELSKKRIKRKLNE